MAIHRYCAFVAISFLAMMQGIQARADDGNTPAWKPDASMKYLDERGNWWLTWPSAARGQGTACISCHTTFPIALTLPALSVHLGEKEPGALEKKLIDNVKKRVTQWQKIVTETTNDKDPFRPYYAAARKPSALGTESVMNALVLVNNAQRRAKGVLDESTRRALGHLWQQQQANGAWLWLDFGLSPWEADSPYFGASLAALAIGTAGKSYYDDADVEPKVAALRKYLTTQYPSARFHHRMTALWASSRLPGILGDQEKVKLREEILNTQEADGGWSLPKLGKTTLGKGGWKSHGVTQQGAVSDGYATGLAILALRSAGLSKDDAAIKKGVGWLTSHQKDGMWPAFYLNKSRDPETDVGKFMRDAATAFAVLALIDND